MWVGKYLSKNIIKTRVSVKKCHVVSLALKNIMPTCLKCMQTEVNFFSVPWTRTLFPINVNGVLESFLVCVNFLENYQMLLKFMLYRAAI